MKLLPTSLSNRGWKKFPIPSFNRSQSKAWSEWILFPVSLLTLLLWLGPVTAIQAGTISTVAGTGNTGYNGDGIVATSAQLANPSGIAVDNSGNLYIADLNNNRIRKVDTSGIISTVAGNGTYGYSGDGGAATSAKLQSEDITVDSSSNLYIVGYFRVRKVDTSGIISTVAGTGNAGYSGDGGPAINAQLNMPHRVAVDSSGNLYIADEYNNCIRKVDTSGIISTVAGTGTQGFSGDGGAAINAQLSYPYDVAFDSSGNLYIADRYNKRIRRVDTNGVINTIAGNGTSGYSGDGGVATSAQLDPQGLAFDSSDNLYVDDGGNYRIRKVNSNGIISTIAGIGISGYSGDGGNATSAKLNFLAGVAIDSNGNLYAADYFNHRIRKVVPAPEIDIQSNTVSITNGDTTPATTDNTDFGNVNVGSTVTKTFTIKNTGELPLNLTGNPSVVVTGNGFGVTTQPTSPVIPFTGTTSVVIQFAPTMAGTVTGAVSIANDDSDENYYTFSIRGVANTINQTITFTPPTSATFGDSPLTLSATGGASGNPVTFASTTTSICTVGGTTLTLIGAGTCTVTANQVGNANYNAAPQVSKTITINKATQTITFTPPASATIGGTLTLSATGGASGNAVTFASTTTSICTVSGTTLTLIGTGTCTVTANQAGNTNYSAAPQVSKNITINKANQTITFTPPASATIGGTLTLSATGGASGNAVTFASTTTSICTVSGTTLTIVSGGTCTVTANQAGNVNYNAAAQVTKNITIGQANQTITFTPPTSATVSDSPLTLSATATSGLTITFASTTPAVCTVSGTTLTLVAAGTCTVTANQAGNANYSAAPQVSKSIVVTLNDTPPTATNVNVNPFGPLQIGQTVMGNYTYSDAEADMESGTLFQWYWAMDPSCSMNKTAIMGATTPTYMLGYADIGQYICFGVTPKNANATGIEVLATTNSQIMPPPALPSPICVSGAGSPEVNGTMTYDGTKYTNSSGVILRYSYQWEIVGAYSMTLYSTYGTNSSLPDGYHWWDTNMGYYPSPTVTIGACIIPNSPSELTATSVSLSEISLSWNDNSNDEDQFIIGRASVSGGPYGWLPLSTSDKPGMGIRYYTEAGLACGTTYYYVVKASANMDSVTTPETGFTTPTCPPNYSSWQLVGTAGLYGSTYHWSASGNISLAIDNNGTPLVGYLDTANNWKASVVKFNGTQWVQVGMAGFSARALSGSGISNVAINDSNIPHVAYSEYNGSGNQASVMKFDGTSWMPMEPTGLTPPCTLWMSLAFNSQDTPYLACTNGYERVNVLKFNTTQWEQVGSAISGGSTSYLAFAIDKHDTPYVAYRDNDSPANLKASVMKFDGSNWVYVGTRGFSAGSLDYVSLVIDQNGTPYIAYLDSANDGKASVQKFDGTQWVYVGTAGFTPSQARFPRLVIDSNNILYVAYSDGLYGGGKASVMKFDGTQWRYVGNAGFSEGSVNDVQLAIDHNDTLYVAYADSAQSNRTTVMKFVNAAPKVNQTLTFTLPFNATLGDAPLTLSASASSGLPVTFVSTTPAVCVVSDTTLTIVGAGICTVTANQAGNANYNAAPPISKNLTVLTKATQTLTFTTLLPTTYGQAPLTLNAMSSSGLTVRYTATGPCTVTGNTLTFTGAGTCNVTASQPGNANYQAASSVTQTFTINKTPLSLTADDKTVNEGSAIPTLTVTAEGFVNGDTTASLDGFTLTTTATASSPAGVYPITVTASDANYMVTLRNGLLTLQAAGFNVTQTSDSTSLTEGGATDTLSVVLKFAPLAEVSVVILPDSQLDLGNGGGVPLTQTFTPSNWNTPQTVTVRAVDDTVVEGTHAGWLAFRTASTDTTFHNKVVADLKATILDNDAGVIVPTYPVAVTTNQKIATYPVQLSTIPTSPVTLTLSSNDPAAILSPATLTFATDASALEPQWVTVTLSKNSYRYLVTVTHTITQGNDANYPTTLAIEDVSLAQSSRSQYTTSQLAVSMRGQGRILSDIGGLTCQNNRGTCKATYLTETAVRLQPIPATGYQFSDWEGSPDCMDSHLLMKPGDSKRCTANFVAVSTTAKVTLSISVTGTGQVTSNTGVMTCQTLNGTWYSKNTCQGSYVPGTLVILTPVPATGYQFSRWTGDKDCTDGMVLMNVKKICNAVFASTTGKRSSLEEDTNRQTCDDTGGQSGISVNGQAFSSCATVTLSDTVTIRGEIPVLPEDVGQTADLVVYAAYRPLEEVEETMPHYLMLDTQGQIWPWDEDPATLVAFQTGVVLAPVQTVDLYQGHFLGTGKLSIFWGYRLGDGMVVVNPVGVVVRIR